MIISAARTPISRYIRGHFDEMAKVMPSRINWTVMRDYLAARKVIPAGTDPDVVKRAWHREKDRRATSRKLAAPSRELRPSGLQPSSASSPAAKPRLAAERPPNLPVLPLSEDETDEPDARPKFEFARPIGKAARKS
jgi:hypothetical protein